MRRPVLPKRDITSAGITSMKITGKLNFIARRGEGGPFDAEKDISILLRILYFFGCRRIEKIEACAHGKGNLKGLPKLFSTSWRSFEAYNVHELVWWHKEVKVTVVSLTHTNRSGTKFSPSFFFWTDNKRYPIVHSRKLYTTICTLMMLNSIHQISLVCTNHIVVKFKL